MFDLNVTSPMWVRVFEHLVPRVVAVLRGNGTFQRRSLAGGTTSSGAGFDGCVAWPYFLCVGETGSLFSDCQARLTLLLPPLLRHD